MSRRPVEVDDLMGSTKNSDSGLCFKFARGTRAHEWNAYIVTDADAYRDTVHTVFREHRLNVHVVSRERYRDLEYPETYLIRFS